MIKILINAITVKEGGGIVVLTKLLNKMRTLDKNIFWIVLVDTTIHDKIQTDDQIKLLSFSWIRKSALHFLYWHEYLLPKLIEKLKIDCFFSQTNLLPIKKLACSTFLLLHHSGYFSKEFEYLHFKYNTSLLNKVSWFLKKKIIFLSVKKADLITVQTLTLSKEILKQTKINKNKLVVIPHGVGIATEYTMQKKYVPKNEWRIGYITKFGVQKNFEVLFQAIQKLAKQNNINFKLALTIHEGIPQFSYIQKIISEMGIAQYIENHGEIPFNKIRDLYLSLDLFLFPSLCESFGFTLLEAMSYGIPIIASDIDSNKELLGDQGMFFEAHNANNLVSQVNAIMNNENLYLQLSQYSLKRSQLFAWEKTAQETLRALKELACSQRL